MTKKVSSLCNTERCLILRQQYGVRMLQLLDAGKHIINVDESWLNESSFIRRFWCHSEMPATITMSGIIPRISLIAALDTDGRTWFTLTQATTDQ